MSGRLLCLIALWVLALPACDADHALVPVRLTHGAVEEPFADATDLSLEFYRRGALEREMRFAPDTGSLDIGVLRFGTDLQLQLHVLAGEFEIARGGSFPFEVLAGTPPPRVDLHVGLLGRFTDAEVAPVDDVIAGVSAGPDGALVATEIGTLYRYTAHAPEDGRPRLTLIDAHPELDGASWMALPGGGLIAVGGDMGRVRRFDDAGAVVAERVDGLLVDHRRGASLAVAEDSVWIVGGSSLDFGGASSAVVRVDLGAGAGLAIERLADLPCATRDSRLERIPIASGVAAVSHRLVLVCGDALRESRVVAIDPAGRGAPAEVTLPGDLRRAALAPLGLGLVLVAGGRDADAAATDAVHVLALGESSLSEIAGASRPLFAPRTDAAAHVLAAGRVLLLGGRDASEQAMASAEIVSFPGRVVLARPSPLPMATPRLTALADGSVLAASSVGIALYVPAL